MKLTSMRGIAILAAAFFSVGAHAGLNLKEAETIQSVAKACTDHQRKVDDFMRRFSGAAPYSDALAAEAFALLSRPTTLPQSYWSIRDRSLSLPIKNAESARDFSATDGRLGQTELDCAGHSDSLAWRFVAEKALSARKADAAFRTRLRAAWKTSIRQQTSHPMSYPQYTKVIETAKHLARLRLIDLPRSVLDAARKLDVQIRQVTPSTRAMPQIANAQDPKWVGWAKANQKRSHQERVLLPAAQNSLAALAR
jgi:hypothetical protein